MLKILRFPDACQGILQSLKLLLRVALPGAEIRFGVLGAFYGRFSRRFSERFSGAVSAS